MNWETADDEEPEPRIRVRPYLQGALPVDEPAEPDDDGPATDGAETSQGLRPFVLTAGRVAGVDPAISLETQVTARLDGPFLVAPQLTRLQPELQDIVTLCIEPMSVAEISARLRLHLGVTKVLVGDLRAAGHLDVHIGDVEDSHDPDLIMRVIDGLRAIS